MPISEAGNATQLARQRGADPTTVGTRILHELEQRGACTIEALTAILPSCSWNQVFMAVDTLSREERYAFSCTLDPNTSFPSQGHGRIRIALLSRPTA